MEHGNLPSKATSTAHALITGDCDVKSRCYLETPWMKRDTEHEWETVGNIVCQFIIEPGVVEARTVHQITLLNVITIIFNCYTEQIITVVMHTKE